MRSTWKTLRSSDLNSAAEQAEESGVRFAACEGPRVIHEPPAGETTDGNGGPRARFAAKESSNSWGGGRFGAPERSHACGLSGGAAPTGIELNVFRSDHRMLNERVIERTSLVFTYRMPNSPSRFSKLFACIEDGQKTIVWMCRPAKKG